MSTPDGNAILSIFLENRVLLSRSVIERTLRKQSVIISFNINYMYLDTLNVDKFSFISFL